MNFGKSYNTYMPDDQNTTQDTLTPDSSPAAPSDTPETPPEAQNAPTEGFTPESPNNPLDIGNAGTAEPQNGPENQDSSSGEAESDPAFEPVQASEPRTAQTPVNEPLPEQPEPIQTQSKQSLARQLLISARNAIQFRKRKKLDRVMTLFLKKSKITNDEVEKFLHVSDATATRYLSELEKEGKIKQNGKTGHVVSYSRI
jgi:hypothetical protein